MDLTTRSPLHAGPGAGSTGRRALLTIVLILPTLPTFAAIDPDATSMSDRIQLNGTVGRPIGALRVTQSNSQPLATSGPLPPQDALQADRSQTARQTMVWADHERSGLGLGIGVEQRRPYASAGAAMRDHQPQMEGGVLVGASLATSPRTHVVVQTPLVNSTAPRALMADDPQFQQDQQRQIRMGLVFNTKKPYSDLRQGLRMEINGQTTLAIKPRGGGRIGFALQKVW